MWCLESTKKHMAEKHQSKEGKCIKNPGERGSPFLQWVITRQIGWILWRASNQNESQAAQTGKDWEVKVERGGSLQERKGQLQAHWEDHLSTFKGLTCENI